MAQQAVLIDPMWPLSNDGKPSLRWLRNVLSLDRHIPDWPGQFMQADTAFQPHDKHDKAWLAPLRLCPHPIPAKWVEWYHTAFADRDSPAKRYYTVQDVDEREHASTADEPFHTPLPYEPWMCYWLRQVSLFGISVHNSKVARDKWRRFQHLYPGWKAADACFTGPVCTGRHPTQIGNVHGRVAYTTEEDALILRMKTDGSNCTVAEIATELKALGTVHSSGAITSRWNRLKVGLASKTTEAPSVDPGLPTVNHVLQQTDAQLESSLPGGALAPLRGLALRDPDQDIMHPKFRIDNSGLSVPSRMKPAL